MSVNEQAEKALVFGAFGAGVVSEQSQSQSINGAAIAGDSETPKSKLRALLIEDDPSDVELALRSLVCGGFAPTCEVVQTAEEFTACLRQNNYDVVLADFRLPRWNGMEAVEILRHENLDIPLIIVSGALGELMAVDCIKQGAADYVLKDHLARLPECVRRALREKQLRDEARHAQQELVRSNRDLEQFAYVASHDLQEPLRMIATYTQLLAERYQGKLDATADKFIHYAVDGALRMQALVQDLLAFSRVGRYGIDCRPTDCNQIVQAAAANLQAAILENDARIHWDPLPVVPADSAQLTQLFQNLIGNAIKFHGPQPPLIQITAEKKRREWLFEVNDNGIGIAPEHFEDVFAIFKRLHTRDEYPGSGIGLAICKKIVEQHGGRIWVKSQPGRGSSFKFLLPASRPESTEVRA